MGKELYELYLEVFKLVFPTKWEDLPEKYKEDWDEFASRISWYYS